MATVTLTKLWLNLASDPSQYRSFEFITSIQSSPSAQTSQEIDADGSVNTISTPGIPKQYAVTLVACDAIDRQKIEVDWLDQPLCVRDDRGRKFYATYSSCQVSEHSYNDQCDISLTFNLISVSETS